MIRDPGYYEFIAGELRNMRSVLLTVMSLEAAVLSIIYTQLNPEPLTFGFVCLVQGIVFMMIFIQTQRMWETAWSHIRSAYRGIDTNSSFAGEKKESQAFSTLKRAEIVIVISFVVILLVAYAAVWSFLFSLIAVLLSFVNFLVVTSTIPIPIYSR